MKQMFGLLLGVCVMIMGGLVLWSLRTKMTIPGGTANVSVTAPRPVRTQVDQETKAQEAGMVTLAGPLADYMAQQDQSGGDSSGSAADKEEDAHPSRPFNPADRVGDSPVGTSTPILKKTFAVAKAVDLPFQIPPHAATPHLRGTFTSFFQRGGARSSDEADVEFLLMNQEQYEDLLNGHPADAQFSTEGSNDQEVNTNMPPTLDRPVKYYLVFRNGSVAPGKPSGPEKIFVHADFRVDY